MDNSFFEYRDKTGADSGSDNEIIDDSMVLESVPYSAKKKNRTVFVAETDESISNDDTEEYIASSKLSKSTARRSSAAVPHVILSSDDDGSRRDSFRKPSESTNNVVVSSSDEEEDYSPELIPKRRPPPQQKANNSNQSLVLQRTKKRMLFQDSDTDNSIIIERNKGNKQKCLKDTPLKIESKQKVTGMDLSLDNDSCDGDDDDENDVDSEEEDDSVKDDDDESDSEKENDEDSGNDDAYDPHPISAIKKKCKKLVINSDESSDENDNTSLNTSSKPNPSLKIDDEKNDENSKNTITKVSKRLVIEDDSDEEIISEALNKTNISNSSHGSDHDINSNNNSQESVEIDDDAEEVEDDDDGPDEDMMVMSRATRMSIMGMIPKDNDSDDSDFIQSDSSTRKSDENQPLSEIKLNNKTSEKSDDDIPEVTINNNKLVNTNIEDLHEISVHSDESRISCSPFSSPLKDITNKSINIEPKRKSKALNSDQISDFMDLTVMPEIRPSLKTTGVIDLSNVESNLESKAEIKMLDKSASLLTKHVANNDDDVTIIDTKPEVIDLSSDDEDEVKPEKKSQGGKSPQQNVHDIPYSESIKQYFAPSRPGEVVYVKKHVKENELNKLNRLKEDLASVRMLLDEMDLSTLPDGGSRLEARHRALEDEVRRQGTRVANMVLEPDNPSSAEMAADGLDAGLSWEDIQKASNAVQPRMFGKQAMATHMAERNLIVDRLRELHASLASRPPERSHAPAPRLLLSTLMPHQRHALAWLRWRETQRPPAGILADDMGLGKTITMISLIASDKEGKIEEDDPPEGTAKERLVRGGTLVVCPASLLQQWAGEVSKHCSARALSVCLHHGAARATQPHRLATHDVVATTYNILQRDSDKNGVLMRVQWRRVILDEAHIVRNHKSATSVAVCGLKGRRRWCLTGTPVQNKDLDLFALLKFLRLSPFDDLQMWKKWIDNKSQGGQERLNIVMQCILLRRTKVGLQEAGQLACLPPRTAHTRLVTLASDEMNVYQKVLVLSKTLFAQFLHQRAEKNSAVTSFAAPANGSEYEKMHKKMIALQGVKPVKSHEILVLLLRLRQVCCHCGLVGSMLDAAEPGAQPEPAAADLLRELDKLSLDDDKDKRKSRNHEEAEEVGVEETAKADEAIRAVLGSSAPVFQLSRPSSKISAVMECLESVFSNKGDKAVVVSQWTSVLSLVEKELNKKKIRSVTLSGAVPVTARPRLIDLVNDEKSDVRVMLLSLCAGGVGINLCGANHLLLLDPHWNPQLEEQAQDRIYRVGQNKPVHIYRFVCVDTVEQTIRKLQEAKLQLAENVLTGAGNKAGSPLSVEELKMLFNMGS